MPRAHKDHMKAAVWTPGGRNDFSGTVEFCITMSFHALVDRKRRDALLLELQTIATSMNDNDEYVATTKAEMAAPSTKKATIIYSQNAGRLQDHLRKLINECPSRGANLNVLYVDPLDVTDAREFERQLACWPDLVVVENVERDVFMTVERLSTFSISSHCHARREAEVFLMPVPYVLITTGHFEIFNAFEASRQFNIINLDTK